jgi:hypothetical protein
VSKEVLPQLGGCGKLSFFKTRDGMSSLRIFTVYSLLWSPSISSMPDPASCHQHPNRGQEKKRAPREAPGWSRQCIHADSGALPAGSAGEFALTLPSSH